MVFNIKFGISDLSIMQFGRSILDSRKDGRNSWYDFFSYFPMLSLEKPICNVFCFKDFWLPELKYFWESDNRFFRFLLKKINSFNCSIKRKTVFKKLKDNNIFYISNNIDDFKNPKPNTFFEISPLISASDLDYIINSSEENQILVLNIKHLVECEKKFSDFNSESFIFKVRKKLVPIVFFQPSISIKEFILKTSEYSKKNWFAIRDMQILKAIIDAMKRNLYSFVYKDRTFRIILEYNQGFNFFIRHNSVKLSSMMLDRIKYFCHQYFVLK